VAKVPRRSAGQLAALYKPKKTVTPTVEYGDVAVCGQGTQESAFLPTCAKLRAEPVLCAFERRFHSSWSAASITAAISKTVRLAHLLRPDVSWRYVWSAWKKSKKMRTPILEKESQRSPFCVQQHTGAGEAAARDGNVGGMRISLIRAYVSFLRNQDCLC